MKPEELKLKPRRRRWPWLLAPVLLLAAAVAAAFLIWPEGSVKEITHPFIARKAEDKIGKIFQGTCSVRGAWVSLQAIRLRAVIIKKAVAPQCTLEVRVPRITVSYRLVPMIRNFRAFMRSIDYFGGDSISVVRKEIINDEPVIRPFAPHRYFPVISGVLLRKAEVALISKGARTVISKGVDFRYRQDQTGCGDIRMLSMDPGNGLNLDSVFGTIRVFWGTDMTLPPSADSASPKVPVLNLDLRAPVMTVQNANTFHGISMHMTVVPGRDARMFFPAGSLQNQKGLSRTTQMKIQLNADRCFVDRRYRVDRITAFAGFNGTILGIDTCTANFGDAPVLLSARYDVPSGRLRYCAVDISGMDLHKIYKMSGNVRGYISGKGDIALNLKPGPLNLDSISGYAEVRGTDLVARNLPIQNADLLRDNLPGLSSVAFRFFKGEIKFGRGQVTLKSFNAYGDPLSMIASGWANDKSAIRLHLFGILNAEYSKNLKDLTRESLIPMGSGSYAFKCRVSGTFQEPDVDIDKTHIHRATKATLERFGRAIRNLFRKKSVPSKHDNLPVIEDDVNTY
jgi:hypothetical protein